VSTTANHLVDEPRAAAALPRDLVLAVVIAAAVTTIVLAAIVAATPSAWQLLGVGRGFVPPERYSLSAFAIVLATTFGQVVGWAAGSGLAFYVMTLVGFPRAFSTWRWALTLVYVGLAVVPLFAYHVLFGGPLLGLPRAGVEAGLKAMYPDAHALLYTAHPFVDGAVLPLAFLFLAALWATGDAPRRSLLVRSVLTLALFATSLAIALSLAIHSTLVHIRF
jgi:hypothetical protein